MRTGHARGERRALLWGGVLLVSLVFAVFGRALANGFVSMDDEPYVTSNPRVQAGLDGAGVRWAFETTREANWHPLTWISHMADVSLFGMKPAGHHLTSVLIHAANAVLLLLLLARLTGQIGRSFCVAALFALHPLRVESVAWVSERKDVLCALFGLAALLAYAGWARSGRRGTYAAAVALYAASLLSKPMLVTLPFLLLLLDFWPLDRMERGRLRGLLLEKAPFFLLSAASCIVTLRVQSLGGAVAGSSVPFAVRLTNALVSYVAYLRQSFAPFSLSVLYPHARSVSAAAVGAAVFLLAVSFAAVRWARKHPYLAVGWFWYLGALVPVIGMVQVGWQARADRYTYLPSVGLAIAVVWGLADLAKRVSAGGRIAQAAAVAAIAFLSFLSFQQIGWWKDSITLYTRGLDVTERNHVLHINLGIEQMRQGETAAGLAHFRQAIEIEPGYWYSHLALGAALLRGGQMAEALPHLQAVFRVHPESEEGRKNLAEAQEKLGTRAFAAGRAAEAAERLGEAAAAQPESARLRLEHASALVAAGQKALAREQLRAALRLSPEWRPAATLLTAMLASDPNATPQEAEEALELARRLSESTANNDPNDLDLLAAAQAQSGRFADAVTTARRAVKIAEASGSKKLAGVIAGRLAFYESSRPYRAENPRH